MGATPGSIWLTPHDIYVQLTTGPGSGSIDTAQRALNASLSGADLLYQAQDLVDRQSGSFNRAKNDVRPVPEKPPEPDITDMTWPFTDYEKKMSDYQSDAQHNIAVFSNYDGAGVGTKCPSSGSIQTGWPRRRLSGCRRCHPVAVSPSRCERPRSTGLSRGR